MIGIIGGGITGLALGHALARRGEDFVVFEAAAEPGGVIRSVRVAGRVLELGPQRTRLTAAVLARVRGLGLEPELVTAPAGLPLFVYHDHRLRRVPLGLSDFLRTDLFTTAGKLRLLAEPFTRGPRPDESVARFFTRAFGRQAYERMLGPLYGGLYASDPAEMDVRHTVQRTLRGLGIRGSLLLAALRRSMRRRPAPPACSFREGLQKLPRTLHAAIADHVRLDAAVRAIEPAGGGYRLAAGDEAIEVSSVVLTVAAAEAAHLLGRAAPAAAERIGRLRYNRLAIAHLESDAALHGLGYQVALDEPLATRGVTWNASLFPDADREGVYTAFLGGAKRPEIVDAGDDEIGETAAREFERATGRPARPLHVARVSLPAWDRSWRALDGLALPPGIHLCANYESRAGIPGRLERAEQLAGALTTT